MRGLNHKGWRKKTWVFLLIVCFFHPPSFFTLTLQGKCCSLTSHEYTKQWQLKSILLFCSAWILYSHYSSYRETLRYLLYQCANLFLVTSKLSIVEQSWMVLHLCQRECNEEQELWGSESYITPVTNSCQGIRSTICSDKYIFYIIV